MKIVCLGDSLTEGLGVTKVDAWPNILQKEISVETINKGISGDTSSGMLARFYHDVLSNNPTHVIICAGGNDLWWNVETNNILANIYSMVKQAIHNKVVPILAIHPPINLEYLDRDTVWEPVAGYEMLIEKANELADQIAKMASINNIQLIDFRIPFKNGLNDQKSEYFIGTDGVHPNELGHIALAKAALNTISQVDESLA